MSCEFPREQPLRQLEFDLDPSCANWIGKIVVPSVGIDLGSYHTRVAVINRRRNEQIRIVLATFGNLFDLAAVLKFAKLNLITEDKVQVFYTGHATTETLTTITHWFPAANLTRRDKLDCHNQGASLLIDCLSPEQVFHDMTESRKRILDSAAFPTIPANSTKQASVEQIAANAKLVEEMRAKDGQKFPFLLSIVGNSYVICHNQSGTYSPVYSRCIGGHYLRTLWNLINIQQPQQNTYEQLLQLASKGNRRKIDTVTNEIHEFVGPYFLLPRNHPVFSFGKMAQLTRDQVAPEDLARATVTTASDALINMAVQVSRVLHTFSICFVGSLIQHEFVRYDILERAMVSRPRKLLNPLFFKTDATAALGACLRSAEVNS